MSGEEVGDLAVSGAGGGKVSVARCLPVSVAMATVCVSMPATGPAMSMVGVGMMFTDFLKWPDTVIRISEASDRQDADGTTTMTPARVVTETVTHLIRS